jgi:FkbH-like protein
VDRSIAAPHHLGKSKGAPIALASIAHTDTWATGIQETMEKNRKAARLVRSSSPQISQIVAQVLEVHIPRWQNEARNFAGDRSEYLAQQFVVFPNYIAEYFDRADATFLQLFVGEMLKALYLPDADQDEANALARVVTADIRQKVAALVSPALSNDVVSRLLVFLDEVSRILTAEPGKTQRVLFVGDCLFLDIVPFVAGPLLDLGIRLVADYATSKNPTVLHDQIRGLGAKKFDLVFFSPFSYEFSLEYNPLLDWKNLYISEEVIAERIERSWLEVRATIDVLADLFDCPIHVHNSAAIVREENAAKRVFKAKISERNRALGRTKINTLLSEYLERRNTETFKHLFLFDERSIVEQFGEIRAGAYFYKTPLQHPAVLGQILSCQYVDLVYVNAWLVKKKVVVCDLDNTLWEGVIGEGQVSHYHDRQCALKALRTRGIVLAVNSKNDPANVVWDDAALCEGDFAYSAISWEPKVHGMRRIQLELNLKIKDFVFIDDREDERALMHQCYPEIVCLDATDSRTWTRIGLWFRFLDDDPDMDRTLMYKQRDARKAFIKESVNSADQLAVLFNSLNLRLTIQRAKPDDLKRVVELINRTNQFNLEGSRTTFREVSGWHQSTDHVIILGQTSDRFGDMGTTCVTVVAFAGDEMTILPFVLSCRVFGYGIEIGVLNHLKVIARQRGMRRIVGRFQATSQNAPCKDFLATNDFVQQGEVWSFELSAESKPIPAWLVVTAD